SCRSSNMWGRACNSLRAQVNGTAAYRDDCANVALAVSPQSPHFAAGGARHRLSMIRGSHV
ncbi:MAG TPA: hypothetical protein VMN43_09695, partial [Aestuariivirgaceae bacterium]|nr:hypothetical protein [Aestuariivirgaceae bacterium]